MKKYDFIIVGAGIFGATCARLLTDKGYKCLILEKNSYVGGLCYDEDIDDVNVTMYGPHVLYTDNDRVWNFINDYADINDYIHTEVILRQDTLFRTPIDMLTLNQLFKKTTSQSAYKCINNEIKNYNVKNVESLEDLCITKFGLTMYGYLLKNFYEKKFGRKCSEMAVDMPFLIPMSLKHESRYFDTKYQGYPMDGYTAMIEEIIGDDIDIMLNYDFIKNIDKFIHLETIILYTGALDELCKYMYGPLPWQSARFKQVNETIRGNYIYGCSVVDVEDPKEDLLRITEHKWFTPERRNTGKYNATNIVTYEYPKKWEPGDPTCYALIDDVSVDLVKKYMDFVNNTYPNVLLCGKNASFDNFTICESIEGAMALCDGIKPKNMNNQENVSINNQTE